MSYDTVILAESSLTHFWKLAEAAGAGTAADSKGATTLTNTSITAGSTALMPDGETSYLFGTGSKCSNASSLSLGSSFSVEVWYSRSNNTGWQSLFANSSDPFGAGFAIHFDSGKPGYSSGGFGGNVNSADSLNTVHQLVFVQNGTAQALYEDGNATPIRTSTHAATADSGGLNIGGAVPADSLVAFQGLSGKISVYNAALSTAQIAAHWAAGIAPPGIFIPNYLTGGIRTLTGGIRG